VEPIRDADVQSELRRMIIKKESVQQVNFEWAYDYLILFLDRIYRINWIFSFERSPEESVQTPIAFGE
jgi:hypothetical protein